MSHSILLSIIDTKQAHIIPIRIYAFLPKTIISRLCLLNAKIRHFLIATHNLDRPPKVRISDDRGPVFLCLHSFISPDPGSEEHISIFSYKSHHPESKNKEKQRDHRKGGAPYDDLTCKLAVSANFRYHHASGNCRR